MTNDIKPSNLFGPIYTNSDTDFLRLRFSELASTCEDLLEEGQELSLVRTKLQEAFYFAVRAVGCSTPPTIAIDEAVINAEANSGNDSQGGAITTSDGASA